MLQHSTMTSSQAIAHVEDLVCSISKSTWLPQWLFDFWVIPYLLGKGISEAQLLSFLRLAHQLLVLKIEQRYRNDAGQDSQTEMLQRLLNEVASWPALEATNS